MASLAFIAVSTFAPGWTFLQFATVFHRLFNHNSANPLEANWHGFWTFTASTPRQKIAGNGVSTMFDIENLMHLGVFNQLIPIWQVFFFIASLLPFLLWNRVKICLLITYMFTYYLGFMVQFGEYISSSGSMQPFVLYALSGLAIAVFFVATIFTEEPEKTKVRWVRFSQETDDEGRQARRHHSDPVEAAINVTNASDLEH
jgi:hypothetical protein